MTEQSYDRENTPVPRKVAVSPAPQPPGQSEKQPAQENELEALVKLRIPQQASGIIKGVPTPQEIKAYLDRFIIGNEKPKRKLAVLAHNHYKVNGMQVSVDDVDRALRQHFQIQDRDDAKYKGYLNLFTRLVRKEELNRKKANPVRTTLKVLLETGISEGILKLQPVEAESPAKEKASPRANAKVKPMMSKKRRGQKADVEQESGGQGSDSDGPKSGSQIDSVTYRVLLSLLKQRQQRSDLSPGIKKESVLIIGPSGSGKTFLCEKLAECLGVPFLFVDSSQITAPGYMGDDATSIYTRLLEAAGGDVELAGKGIVMLDEIDKKAGSRYGRGDSDVGGSGAQSSLLRILEGHVDHQTGVDSSRVMFILAGKFGGLEQIVERRLGQSQLGFSRSGYIPKTAAHLISKVNAEDLVEFGILRELIGRVGSITTTDPMDQQLLERIIEESESSPFKDKKSSLAFDGVELILEGGARTAIASFALEQKIGVRGLRSILSELVEELAYNAPNLDGRYQGRFVIDEDFVRRSLGREQ